MKTWNINNTKIVLSHNDTLLTIYHNKNYRDPDLYKVVHHYQYYHNKPRIGALKYYKNGKTVGSWNKDSPTLLKYLHETAIKIKGRKYTFRFNPNIPDNILKLLSEE